MKTSDRRDVERRRGGIGGAEPQERLRPVDNGAVRPTELEGVEAGGGEWDEGEGIVRQAKYETLMLEQKKQKHRRNDDDDDEGRRQLHKTFENVV